MAGAATSGGDAVSGRLSVNEVEAAQVDWATGDAGGVGGCDVRRRRMDLDGWMVGAAATSPFSLSASSPSRSNRGKSPSSYPSHRALPPLRSPPPAQEQQQQHSSTPPASFPCPCSPAPISPRAPHLHLPWRLPFLCSSPWRAGHHQAAAVAGAPSNFSTRGLDQAVCDRPLAGSRSRPAAGQGRGLDLGRRNGRARGRNPIRVGTWPRQCAPAGRSCFKGSAGLQRPDIAPGRGRTLRVRAAPAQRCSASRRPRRWDP
ncbi:hypothetical protein PVAP13_4NG086141 [Panicum virgatum]|uniref:Uncharacterized protein n=1 Tax=Panicum virgatum TaxID=38727 RepID=A0A8T0TB38_PANVG|nr:hypothetical protein PVAP13_4NG086141 [Panicum virgatum]